MHLSILRGLASRCARDAYPRGMTEYGKPGKTCSCPFCEGWRPVVHGTPTLTQWQKAKKTVKGASENTPEHALTAHAYRPSTVRAAAPGKRQHRRVVMVDTWNGDIEGISSGGLQNTEQYA